VVAQAPVWAQIGRSRVGFRHRGGAAPQRPWPFLADSRQRAEHGPAGSLPLRAERVNTFETVSSQVGRHSFTVMAGGEWSISLLPSACARVTIDAGSGLIDTVCGGALARGAPLTKRSGLRW